MTDAQPEVEVTIDLLTDEEDNGFKLGGTINVTLNNMSQKLRKTMLIKPMHFVHTLKQLKEILMCK